MKIKLNQTSAGPAGVILAGTIITVDDVTGKTMVDTRQGVEVKDSFPDEPVSENKTETIETATAPDVPETSDGPARRRGRPPKIVDEETPKEG
jgi:hypothetical protein